MNSTDDIPVLDAIREQLIAGIRERGSRHRRPAIASAVGVIAALGVVAAVLFAAQLGGHGRQVIVHGPPVGQPGKTDSTAPAGVAASNSTTTVTASAGDAAFVTTSTTRRPSTPTTVAQLPPSPATTQPSTGTPPPAPGTISLTVADRNRSLTVSRGTIIDVHLDGDNAAIWPTEPGSTDGGVLQHLSGSNSPTSSRAQFAAQASGSAQLTAIGGRPCPAPPPTGPPQGCVSIGVPWAVTVNVT